MSTHHASCLCGSVHCDVEIDSPEIHCCHCKMCRRWGGGPAFVVTLAKAPQFSDASALKIYRSSEWAERLFCRHCGTSVLWRSLDGTFQALPVALLDDAPDLPFTTEVFIDDKPDYYTFAGTRTCLTGAQAIAAFTETPDKTPEA
ncbi:GFA family protein [Rhodovibrio salinarum]|uniref:CENP-V/GFA domain-containing protein n=1 Tax=Rhodovibrio salinarum TaxID=1087 RepID=A0A934QF87_9PROT|nr:GFA family protein [Rhodovibrio salinarum]MBK1695986.1 hypothetical protein [Rhodovibrio salinarum]